MSQLPPEYDNPIDNICYDISEFLAPHFRKVSATPNQITTLSLCFGLLSAYALSNRSRRGVGWFVVLYLVQFVLDCLDGHYARKYKMISEIGDWYDHVKDVVLYLLICYILTTKYGLSKHYVALTVVIVLPILQYIYNGCVSVYRNTSSRKGQVTSMTLGEKMCHYDHNSPQLIRNLSYLRWVGPGTCAMGICLVAIYLYQVTIDK
jgi:phosphatidylglycerophosphate synthase